MPLILLMTVVFLLFVVPVVLIVAFLDIGNHESGHLTTPQGTQQPPDRLSGDGQS